VSKPWATGARILGGKGFREPSGRENRPWHSMRQSASKAFAAIHPSLPCVALYRAIRIGGVGPMSVLETDIVDYIYLDDDEETPVLVVSDPLAWQGKDQAHLDALRDKLNAQIAFVESGQIKGVWPYYDGGRVKVEVVARCALNEAANAFYVQASRVMTKANMDLCFRLWDA
jgi:hypothetical protein